MQRFTINRDFLEQQRQAGGTGKYREFADDHLRGFGVKITPQGGIAYYYRWTGTDGKHHRKVVGHYPTMTPSAAREHAKKLSGTLDHSRDDDVTLIAKQATREANAERAKVVPTVGEFLSGTYAKYFRTQSRNNADRTIAMIRDSFPGLMDKPLNKVSTKDIEDWRTDELSRVLKPAMHGMPAKLVKPATANRKLNALRGLLTYAHTTKVITENPGTGVAKQDEGSGVVRWLRPDEETRLRAALRARDGLLKASGCADAGNTFADLVEPAVLLSIDTGLRRGELLQLRWDDIDLDRRMVTVRDETSKCYRTRHLPLCEEAFEVASAWKVQCFRTNVRPLYVFVNAAGGLLREVAAWTDVLKAANITGFRWHDLRHSFATRAVEQGVPIDMVSRWLGHSRVEQTMRYAHRSPTFASNAIAALDRARIAALSGGQQLEQAA
ncbi:site-specific integrase [Paraburkholderia caribensis]|nr:site-specific integrase [Paraburkholderia caribensis]MCO4880512.1 site-specific integrase [Paraburkholderia caribensis]